MNFRTIVMALFFIPGVANAHALSANLKKYEPRARWIVVCGIAQSNFLDDVKFTFSGEDAKRQAKECGINYDRREQSKLPVSDYIACSYGLAIILAEVDPKDALDSSRLTERQCGQYKD